MDMDKIQKLLIGDIYVCLGWKAQSCLGASTKVQAIIVSSHLNVIVVKDMGF